MTSKYESIQTLTNIVRSLEDKKSVSLAQFTKKTSINSAVFIQDSVSSNAIVGDIMKVMLNLQTGYVLNALQLNTYISDTTTIRDYLETVATEDFKYIDNKNIGNDFNSSFTGQMLDIDDIKDRYSTREPDTSNDLNTSMARPIEWRTDNPYPSGRLIDVTIQSPHNRDVRFTVSLMVNLTPRVVHDSVMEQFITLNIDKDIYKRWLQWKAGEIKFFKDFIFEVDMLNKRKEALKRDTTGDLLAMLEKTKTAISERWMKLLFIKPNKQNIANTINIFDKYTFNKITNNSGYNFKRYSDRQKYFSRSYAMSVIVVDQDHNMVDMYWNGLENRGEYTFNQLQSASKKDTLNLMAAMSQMSQNKPITF